MALWCKVSAVEGAWCDPGGILDGRENSVIVVRITWILELYHK